MVNHPHLGGGRGEEKRKVSLMTLDLAWLQSCPIVVGHFDAEVFYFVLNTINVRPLYYDHLCSLPQASSEWCGVWGLWVPPTLLHHKHKTCWGYSGQVCTYCGHFHFTYLFGCWISGLNNSLWYHLQWGRISRENFNKNLYAPRISSQNANSMIH